MGRKKDLFLVLDTETSNDLDNPLVYDLGFAICDRYGKVYYQKSYVIEDTFLYDVPLMKTAYYAEKLPQYYNDISNGTMKIINIQRAKKIIQSLIKDYNIKAVCAYNASFDLRALNTTLRYYTKSQQRWFLPYGINVYCIWHMACQTLYKQAHFFKFVEQNDLFSNSGNIQTSAEIGYKYLTKNNQFAEKHRGLDDVKIELFIMAQCFRQKKKINKNINRGCWSIPTKEYKNRKALKK